MYTDNKCTCYLRGRSKKTNSRAGSGARTQRGVARKDGGWGRNGGDDSPEGGSGCCVASNSHSVTAWKEFISD